MIGRFFSTLAILFVAFVFASASAFAAGCPVNTIKTPFHWVSLANDPAGLERLENLNRLREICPQTLMAEDHARYIDCVTEAMRASIASYAIHGSPEGPAIGALIVRYTPGDSITFFINAEGFMRPFTPHVHDPDWGYGPWAESSLLDKDGAWIKVALPYLPGGLLAGWINLPSARIHDVTDESDRVYEIGDNKTLSVITGRTKNTLDARDSQDSDMWCEAGDPPPLKAFTTRSYSLDELYDDSCQLLVWPAYMRGC